MKDAFKVIGGVVGGILLLIGIGLGTMYLTGTLQKLTADFRGDVAATESVVADGRYRIAAYNEFFERCGAIQALEDQITIAEEEFETATPDRRQFITVNLTALKNQRAEQIRTYNADATKADTQARFLASDLPYQITIEGKTTCAAS